MERAILGLLGSTQPYATTTADWFFISGHPLELHEFQANRIRFEWYLIESLLSRPNRPALSLYPYRFSTSISVYVGNSTVFLENFTTQKIKFAKMTHW